MSEVLGVVVNGFALGSVYALVAVGFVIVFRSTEVFNFAHGYAMVLGAYIAVSLVSRLAGLPFVLIIAVALLLTAMISAIVFLVTLRPLLGERLWAPAMVTVGLSVVAQAVVGVIWANEPRQLKLPWASTSVHVIGTDVTLSSYTVGTMAISVLFFIVIIGFFRYVKLGRQMRAAAENPRLASWSGINVTRLFVVAWAIAGLAAALAGVALGSNGVVSADLSAVGLRAVPAALLGGLSSVPGAFVGAIVVGTTEVAAATYLGSATRDVAAFGVMLIVLLFRPSGLLGSAEVKRV